MQGRPRGRRWRATVGVTVAAAVVMGACGGSGTSTSRASSPAGSAGSSAPVSTLPAPHGDPIGLAMITQESGPAALPDSRLAAEAAVKYVNTELGGAAGRPLELQTCVG